MAGRFNMLLRWISVAFNGPLLILFVVVVGSKMFPFTLGASVQSPQDTDAKVSAGQCGSGTYYIHEYHVHGDGDISESGIIPMFPQKPEDKTEELINMTEYLKEKDGCLQRRQQLQEQLADERTRRLDIMARLVSWISVSGIKSQSNIAIDKHITALRDMLFMWNEAEGWNYTEILQDISQSANDTPTGTTVQDDKTLTVPDTETSIDQCGVCNLTYIEEIVSSFQSTGKNSKGLEKEVKRLHKRYLNVYDGYKRVLATTRELQRNLRSWEHRAGRLLKLYEDQFANKATSPPTHQPDSAADEIKALTLRIWCLEQGGDADPVVCPNVKPTPVPPITPSRTTRPSGITGDYTLPYDVTSEGSFTEEDTDSGNVTALTAGSMIRAGIRVSSWYLDQIRNQRPKDCADIDYWVQRQEPIQTIYLQDRTRPVKALCDEGWTVIMKNIPFGVNPLQWDQDQDRLWVDYKFGYGTFETDQFWFGNQYLYQMTNQDDYQLIINMEQTDDQEKVFTEYAFFRVTEEKDGFRLEIGDNRGTAGDILGVHSPTPLNRLPFASIDMHGERLSNLIQMYKEGWWYPRMNINVDPSMKPDPCFTHLTYKYPWSCGARGFQMLSSVVMKIRPLHDNS